MFPAILMSRPVVGVLYHHPGMEMDHVFVASSPAVKGAVHAIWTVVYFSE